LNKLGTLYQFRAVQTTSQNLTNAKQSLR